MKLISTVFSLFVFLQLSFAQTTNIADTLFEQALINLGYDTGVPDGSVPTANIDTIKILDVSNNSISDLSGIEDFMALEDLNCSNNQLSSLNLSSNTALLKLNVYNNQVSNLDLSTNTALTELYAYNNQMNSLNVRTCTSLTVLYCQNNNLASLDISNNLLLQSFYASGNSFITFDISVNTALTEFSVGSYELISVDLRNSNNSNMTVFLTGSPNLSCIYVDTSSAPYLAGWTIDGTANYSFVENDGECYSLQTYVPDDSFEQALIDLGIDSLPLDDSVSTALIGAISNLDISNKNISDLSGIEDFINLSFLNCASNQLSTIDLSENKALTTLISFNNQLNSLIVRDNPELTTLNCFGNQISNLDLSANANLIALVCNSNQLASLDVSANTALRDLFCTDNQLTDLDVSANPALTDLFTSRNQLLNLDVRNGNNSNLVNFDASGNPNLNCIYVDDRSANILNSWIIDNNATFVNNETQCLGIQTYVPDDNFEQALINLNLDSGPLNDSVPTDNINSLTYLGVGSSNINDLTGIEDFVSLENLNCENNQLSSLDISSNINLEVLWCYGNQLSSLDISNNAKLNRLDCYNNQLNSLDVSNNAELSILDIGVNQLSTIDLSNNDELAILSIGENLLDSLDVSGNTALKELWCNDNNLLIMDLKQNINLEKIVAYSNDLRCFTIKNGNNRNINDFRTGANPNLNCIEVDDTSYSATNWTNIDPASSFSTDCGICDTTIQDTVSLAEFSTADLLLYPNPTNGIVRVEFGSFKTDITAILRNTLGQEIATASYKPSDYIEIEIDAPKGVYFLQLITRNGESRTIKILKE